MRLFFLLFIQFSWSQDYNLFLKKTENRILLDSIFIDGKYLSGYFLFDTGSDRTLVFSETINLSDLGKKKLFRPKYTNTYYGKKPTSYHIIENLKIGELEINETEVGIVPFNEFYNPCFDNIIGIIGLDIIKNYSWRFDFQDYNGKVSKRSFQTNDYDSVPIIKNYLIVGKGINFVKDPPIKTAKILYDTGTPHELIVNIDSKKEIPSGVKRSEKYFFADNQILSKDSIIFGGKYYQKNFTYSEHLKTSVGQGFFRNSQIILNKGLRNLHYKNIISSDGYIKTNFGFNIIINKYGEYEVYRIYENSIADKIGLKIGNILEGINETSFRGKSCSEVNQIIDREFENHQNQLTITLKGNRILKYNE